MATAPSGRNPLSFPDIRQALTIFQFQFYVNAMKVTVGILWFVWLTFAMHCASGQLRKLKEIRMLREKTHKKLMTLFYHSQRYNNEVVIPTDLFYRNIMKNELFDTNVRKSEEALKVFRINLCPMILERAIAYMETTFVGDCQKINPSDAQLLGSIDFMFKRFNHHSHIKLTTEEVNEKSFAIYRSLLHSDDPMYLLRKMEKRLGSPAAKQNYGMVSIFAEALQFIREKRLHYSEEVSDESCLTKLVIEKARYSREAAYGFAAVLNNDLMEWKMYGIGICANLTASSEEAFEDSVLEYETTVAQIANHTMWYIQTKLNTSYPAIEKAKVLDIMQEMNIQPTVGDIFLRPQYDVLALKIKAALDVDAFSYYFQVLVFHLVVQSDYINEMLPICWGSCFTVELQDTGMVAFVSRYHVNDEDRLNASYNRIKSIRSKVQEIVILDHSLTLPALYADIRQKLNGPMSNGTYYSNTLFIRNYQYTNRACLLQYGATNVSAPLAHNQPWNQIHQRYEGSSWGRWCADTIILFFL